MPHPELIKRIDELLELRKELDATMDRTNRLSIGGYVHWEAQVMTVILQCMIIILGKES